MPLIAGVDEVGRGPLAGPVLAAAVILNKRQKIVGLADSKKLSEKKRNELSAIIKSEAIAWAIGIASVKEIDKYNILQASLLAMNRAIINLKVTPEEVLVDGNRCPDTCLPARAIIGGDGFVPEISAASIIAKVARDYLMSLLDKRYPQFEFAQHKGYATQRHLHAIKLYGITPLHRRSFAPVKDRIVV